MREICFPVKKTEYCSPRKILLPRKYRKQSALASGEGGTPCFQDDGFVQGFPDTSDWTCALTAYTTADALTPTLDAHLQSFPTWNSQEEEK